MCKVKYLPQSTHNKTTNNTIRRTDTETFITVFTTTIEALVGNPCIMPSEKRITMKYYKTFIVLAYIKKIQTLSTISKCTSTHQSNMTIKNQVATLYTLVKLRII